MVAVSGLGSPYWDRGTKEMHERRQKVFPRPPAVEESEGLRDIDRQVRRLNLEDVQKLVGISRVMEEMVEDTTQMDEESLTFINEEGWGEVGDFFFRILKDGASISEIISDLKNQIGLIKRLDLLDIKPNIKFNQKVIEYLNNLTERWESSVEVWKNIYLLSIGRMKTQYFRTGMKCAHMLM